MSDRFLKISRPTPLEKMSARTLIVNDLLSTVTHVLRTQRTMARPGELTHDKTIGKTGSLLVTSIVTNKWRFARINAVLELCRKSCMPTPSKARPKPTTHHHGKATHWRDYRITKTKQHGTFLQHIYIQSENSFFQFMLQLSRAPNNRLQPTAPVVLWDKHFFGGNSRVNILLKLARAN